MGVAVEALVLAKGLLLKGLLLKGLLLKGLLFCLSEFLVPERMRAKLVVFFTDVYQIEIDCLSRNGIERFFFKFRVISALSDAILVMSLPNSCFSALGYEASARAYKTLYLLEQRMNLRHCLTNKALFPQYPMFRLQKLFDYFLVNRVKRSKGQQHLRHASEL